MSDTNMQLRPLHEIAETNPETLSANTSSNYRFRYIDLSAVEAGFIHWGMVAETNFGSAPSRARRVARHLDVLFGTVRPNLKSHGFIGADQFGELVASTGFSVIRAVDGVSYPAYLFHSLMSDNITAQAIRDAVGSSYPALNDSDVKGFQLFVPSYEDQKVIAQILDTLDSAIRETEAIIAKLKAVKQGLLHDLLTRGIDSNGELHPPQAAAPHLYKRSPLGWIPQEWEIVSLENACANIVDWPHSTPNFQDSGVLVARTMHIKEGNFHKGDASYVSELEYKERIARLEPSSGDLIFTREAPVGEAFIIPKGMKICLGQRVMLLRPDAEKLTGAYLLAQIYSGAVKERIATLTSGTTNPHLNVTEVKDFEIPLPNLDEQAFIVKHTQALDHRLHSEKTTLNKLCNHKSALMNDLLTGRVRVTPLLDLVAT